MIGPELVGMIRMYAGGIVLVAVFVVWWVFSGIEVRELPREELEWTQERVE